MSAQTMISCSSALRAETTTFWIRDNDVTPEQALDQFGLWLAAKAVVRFLAAFKGENEETQHIAIDFGHISRLHAHLGDPTMGKYEYGISFESLEVIPAG